ncbi:MAG TPA: porin [Stellaceae bacterium]|nr:porin [Stellaceae bacterium]
MTSIRRIGAIAAIGALTASAAAIAPVKADELSDLRANQEVLQQRLDQLAQVGTAKPNLPPGSATIAGSFPRSFLIPGTDTSIQIGGYVDLSASYFFTGGANNANVAVPPVTGAPVASGLPLAVPVPTSGLYGQQRQYGWFRMQASESRLFVETRTPTAWGQALTHVEFDFFGCTAGTYCNDLNTATNPDTPRLRLAYGTLGGFIAGQTWVPGNDLAAAPDIFDFGGDVGGWGWARAPQIGYKTDVPWLYGASVGVYAVQPYTQVATPLGSFTDESIGVSVGSSPVAGTPATLANIAKTQYPDMALVMNWEQPWGHFQLHGMVKDMELSDGLFLHQNFIGYGGGFSGSVKPEWFGWSKDNLGFQAFAGDGLGHWNGPPGSTTLTYFQGIATNYGGAGLYGNPGNPDTATAAVKSTAAGAAAITATTVFSWGGEVNYQHWWTPNLRSSLTFGIGHQDLPTHLLGITSTSGYNKEIETAHANLIWSPVPFIDTGFEYIYGHRLTAANIRGTDEHTLDFDFKVKF